MSKSANQTKDPMGAAVRACRDAFGWALTFSGFVALLYLAPSLYMMQVYDRVLNSGSVETLLLVSAVLVLALASLAILDSLRGRLMNRIALRLDRIISPTLLELGLNAQRRPEFGSAVREFDTLRQIIAGSALISVMDAVWVPIFILVAFAIHFWIGVLAIISGAVLVIIALRNEAVLRGGIAKAADLGPALHAAQDADRAGGEAANVLGMRGVLITRQLRGRAELNAAQMRTAFVSSRYGAFSRFWRLTAQSAALGLGAYLAIERQISPGSLIAASIVVGRAVTPFEQIVGAWRQLGQALKSYHLVARALSSMAPNVERTALPAPQGPVTFENVFVRAPETDALALQAVNVSFAQASITGIVGPSGAGKSTLARACVGATPLASGSVRMDGAKLSDWRQDVLGRHIGYLPQDVSLLSGTIAENIRRFESRDAANAAEIDEATVKAAIAAGAHAMILRLPAAYDTRLGPGGAGLSAGQAQRIALARALYRDPHVIVLDEPNAHLDGEGEAALIEAVNSAKKRGAVVLMVAHRASALASADQLVVLQNGKVEIAGPKEEVMRRLASARAPQQSNVTPMRPAENPS